MTTRTPAILLVACIASFAMSAEAADLAKGEAKVKEVCQACHGLDGNAKLPDYPKLGGQYADYMEKALRDYKSGARKNPIMAGFAGTLSEQDIENVAAYFAAQKPVLASKY